MDSKTRADSIVVRDADEDYGGDEFSSEVRDPSTGSISFQNENDKRTRPDSVGGQEQPVQDDDGFFSNLFVKWKSNPVFGKQQDGGENTSMSEQPEGTDDSYDGDDKTKEQLKAINNQGQL